MSAVWTEGPKSGQGHPFTVSPLYWGVCMAGQTRYVAGIFPGEPKPIGVVVVQSAPAMPATSIQGMSAHQVLAHFAVESRMASVEEAARYIPPALTRERHSPNSLSSRERAERARDALNRQIREPMSTGR